MVELGQVLDILEPVGGIGIGGKANGGPAVADRAEHPGVPARFALDLDALVAGDQRGLDTVHQRLDGGLDSERNPAGDGWSRAAQQ